MQRLTDTIDSSQADPRLIRPTTADCRPRSRLRIAWPTTVDHQLEKRQRFDQFVESVPYRKLSGHVSPPFHSAKSHWFSVRAGATETDRGNSNAVKSLVGLKGARKWNAKLRLFGEAM
jgi:hypothetical protein